MKRRQYMPLQYHAVYPHLFKQFEWRKVPGDYADFISLIIEGSYDMEDFLSGCGDFADKIPAAENITGIFNNQRNKIWPIRGNLGQPASMRVQFVIRWLIIR